jgi:nucleotide-binding universal stress UspA family protein
MRFRRILVPHDFSPHADRALRLAAALAGPRGRVVVLHAIVPVMPYADLPVAGLGYYVSSEELEHGARRQLARIVQRTLGPTARNRVTIEVEVGDPVGTILRHTRGMDVVVISTAGRTGLRHLIIGSVAERIVRYSPIPVLSLRAEAVVSRRRGSRRR